jgi:hypothetical protein
VIEGWVIGRPLWVSGERRLVDDHRCIHGLGLERTDQKQEACRQPYDNKKPGELHGDFTFCPSMTPVICSVIRPETLHEHRQGIYGTYAALPYIKISTLWLILKSDPEGSLSHFFPVHSSIPHRGRITGTCSPTCLLDRPCDFFKIIVAE